MNRLKKGRRPVRGQITKLINSVETALKKPVEELDKTDLRVSALQLEDLCRDLHEWDEKVTEAMLDEEVTEEVQDKGSCRLICDDVSCQLFCDRDPVDSRYSCGNRVFIMSQNYNCVAPEPFNFSNPGDWPKWIRRFERFRQASGLINNPENEQVNMLVYCMGDNADDILLSCKIASDQLENYGKVIECFESHFIPRLNIIYERARFNQRCQQEGEEVNEFITALHSLAEHCNFGMLHDELIRDRIVVGVRDRALSERMQLDTDLTLVKATLMAKQLESVKEQQSSLYQQDSVDQIKKMPNHIKEAKRHEPKIRQFKSNQLGGSSHGCTRCGNSNNHDWKNCPAMNSYCSKCKKKGHYAKVCISEAINEIKSEIAFLGSVEDNSKKWIVPIKQFSSGGRGGQRGRLGSGDNRGCYNCGEEGHRKFECTKPARGGGRGRGQSRDGGSNNTCYNCGEVGHRKYECTNNTAEDGGQEENQRKSKKACYTCGEFGHKKDDCPKSGTHKSGDEEESSDNEEEDKSKKKEEYCYLTLQAHRTMPLESARSREMRRPPLRHQPGSQGDARMTRSKRPRRIALYQRPHLQEMEGCRGTTKTRIQRRASLQCQPCIQDMEGQSRYLEEECFKLNKTLEADKVSVLLTSIDVNVYKTLRDLLVPRRPSDLKYKDLVEVLTNHLYPIKNKHYERYLFHKIVQKENEPVGKFVLRLKSQADKCKFSDINENLCDQFVSGCFDEATLKRLLSEPFLTFDSAINIANSVEAAKSQVNLMKNPGHDIDKLKARSKNFKFPCKYNNPCKICGKSNHDTKLCKFKNAQCYICNKKGHIAPVCWNKKSAQNSGMNKPNQNKLNTIQCNTLENAPKIMVNVKIEDADTIMEVDTGADVSVVSKKFFLTNLKNVTLEKYSGHLKSFSGNLIPVFGKCLVNVSYKNYQEKLPLIVTGQFNNQTPLLGRNWIRILKADWPNCVFDICNNINVISNLELFLKVYKRVFENKDLPIQGIKGSISLRPNAKPKFFKFRPVPFSIKEKIDKELDRLEKSQIIEKVNASDWSTPLVTVIKSNGELRLCGDFKNTLNNCIEDEKYPLPTIETMLGNLGGNKIFTKLDLSSAYHQIEMDEASKNLLVVSTHRGLYRYNRLPFGISPASAIFQRCMDSLFHDVPNTVIYLDDIFIGSKDEQEHYRILKMIFDKLKELNFTLNKEKCLFLKKDICFLGHIINEDGVRPDSKKLEALERCKKPFDKTSLKSFLGMLSFYSKYIPNMSTLAGPLYQLLKKDNRWKWSSQCEKAFLNLKLTLLNSQALIHYSMKLPLTLTCDASAYGISGVLCHIVEGEEKPITFVSRTLSSAEVKYSQTEKEALAIVFATSKMRQYLFGRKFVLKSDHKALTTVFGNKRLLPPLIANRLHRWALELSNFDFDIRYTNKDTMLCADAFSRLPLEEINSREDNIDLVTHDISFLNVTPLDHLIIEEETNKDPVLNKLKEYLLEDPQLAKKDETMKPFLSKLEKFSVLQGCIFVDSRAVIPRICQDQMLKLLHQSHIGINRMKSLARSSVWWPKMDSQIEEFVKECSPCMHHQTAPPAENTPWPRTNQPWQRVHVDHFYFRGDCYLLVVDANSNWIEVFPVRGTTSQENIKLLRECFARNTPTSLDKPPVERLLSYVPRTFVNCLNSEFIQKTFGRNECGRRHFQVGDKVLFTRVIQNRRKWFKAQVIRRLGYNVYLVKNLKGTFKVHVNQMRTGSDTKYAEDSDWTLDNAGAGPHRLEQDPQISTSPPPRRSTRPRCPPCRHAGVCLGTGGVKSSPIGQWLDYRERASESILDSGLDSGRPP
ncbi:K02A2.6-like, partial [Cordylochernes scorpioides]